ncbi:MAG: ABC transporter substrate-binding protein [Lachnospiraceae bacterium]|nr:ABC transporter substrate-binding protein [Lachnospiraceae bacterium]
MKKFISCLLAGIMLTGLFTGCGSKDSENSLIVLNYGKYLDPEAIEMFEEETGIKVEYEEYVTPENMYTKYRAGAIDYDLICTSDYMVEKMIQEDQVQKINFDNIPLKNNLDSTYFEFSKSFDSENEYSIPYFFGTVGILYNKDMVDESKVDSWNILWDKDYAGQIIMADSVRDSFMVALKILGYSLNTTDETQWKEAQDLLLKQKPLVYSYLVDEAQDEMIGENAAMAVVYSGEAGYALEFNDKLAFSVPKEGSNMWIDSWFIPKSAKHKENAEKFLNFLCREDISMMNFDYVYYATPNVKTKEALEPEIQESPTIFPPKETLDNCEVLKPLDDASSTKLSILWKEIKAAD